MKTLDLVYDLVDDIKSKQEYKRYIELHQKMEEDQEIKELIKVFNKIKVKYEEVSKYGKYHPDLKQVQQELSVTKAKVYEHPVIKEYKELEKDIQKELNHISAQIAQSVSLKIKHPNDIGLIKKH